MLQQGKVQFSWSLSVMLGKLRTALQRDSIWLTCQHPSCACLHPAGVDEGCTMACQLVDIANDGQARDTWGAGFA